MTTAGRPLEVEDRKTVCFESGAQHRAYIAVFIEKVKQSTGFHLTRSAAVRRIIEEHRDFTALADTSTK